MTSHATVLITVFSVAGVTSTPANIHDKKYVETKRDNNHKKCNIIAANKTVRLQK